MAGYKVKILDKAGNFVASISTEAESPEKAISNVRKNWAQVKFKKDPIALAIHKAKAKYLFVPQEIRPEPRPEPVAPAKSPPQYEQLELFSGWVADNCRFAKKRKRRKRRRKETEEGAAGTGGSNNGGSMSLDEKTQIEIGIFSDWVKGNCKFASVEGLTFENTHRDYVGSAGQGEHKYWLLAKLDGRPVGGIEYAVAVPDNEATIEWIEVVEEHRRKGIGTALHRELRKALDREFPGEGVEVKGSMTTPEGQALRDSLDEVEEAAGALMVTVGLGPMSEEVGISRIQ